MSSTLNLPAIASPVRATRALAPGGSFICPYTRAAFEPGMGLPVALSTKWVREKSSAVESDKLRKSYCGGQLNPLDCSGWMGI